MVGAAIHYFFLFTYSHGQNKCIGPFLPPICLTFFDFASLFFDYCSYQPALNLNLCCEMRRIRNSISKRSSFVVIFQFVSVASSLRRAATFYRSSHLNEELHVLRNLNN